MKNINPNELESSQHYNMPSDDGWKESKEDLQYICGYCMEVPVKFESVICEKCMDSIKKLGEYNG